MCARLAQTRRQVGIASGQFTLGGGSGSDIYNPSGPQWQALVAGPTPQTCATCLATILCWSLETGLWHRTRRKFFVFHVLSPTPLLLSSACPPILSTWIFFFLNPGDSTRKLLELINDYSKVAGYKINTQKSLAFLYTNSEKIEKLRKQFHSPLQRK